jgi:hypothetical protein
MRNSLDVLLHAHTKHTINTTTTLSPGSTKLAKQVSIPAEPGADTGMVNSFSVYKASDIL